MMNNVDVIIIDVDVREFQKQNKETLHTIQYLYKLDTGHCTV